MHITAAIGFPLAAVFDIPKRRLCPSVLRRAACSAHQGAFRRAEGGYRDGTKGVNMARRAYQLFIFQDTQVARRMDRICANDVVARRWAREFVGAHLIEVYCGYRLVVRIKEAQQPTTSQDGKIQLRTL